MVGVEERAVTASTSGARRHAARRSRAGGCRNRRRRVARTPRRSGRHCRRRPKAPLARRRRRPGDDRVDDPGPAAIEQHRVRGGCRTRTRRRRRRGCRRRRCRRSVIDGRRPTAAWTRMDRGGPRIGGPPDRRAGRRGGRGVDHDRLGHRPHARVLELGQSRARIVLERLELLEPRLGIGRAADALQRLERAVVRTAQARIEGGGLVEPTQRVGRRMRQSGLSGEIGGVRIAGAAAPPAQERGGLRVPSGVAAAASPGHTSRARRVSGRRAMVAGALGVGGVGVGLAIHAGQRQVERHSGHGGMRGGERREGRRRRR